MDQLRKDLIEKTHKEILELVDKAGVTPEELIILCSNLVYSLGASLGGYEGTGPSREQLQKLYYERPTVDVAMMMQALIMTTWYEDFKTQQQLTDLTKKEGS